MKIFNTIFTFISIISAFDIAAMEGLHSREKCNWVLGSNRAGHPLGHYVDIIANTNSKTDHINSYAEYPTISMDLNKCLLPNVRHVEGNAEKFDFSPYLIQNVYFERFPTFNESDEFNLELKDRLIELPAEQRVTFWLKQGNMIGNVIQKILPHMADGALLEIEWHPYTLFFPSLSDNDRKQYMEANPFTGYLLREDIFKLGRLFDHENLDDISQKAMEFIRFYQEHGLKMDDNALSAELKKDIESFNTDGGASINSLLFLLQIDLSVHLNKQAAISFLAEHGFENVSLSRTTSTRNLRENVWILQGKKRTNSHQ